MKTQWVPDTIDPALEFDGFVFKNHNARGRYIGTDLAKRPQWVKDNPDKCISKKAIHEKAARQTNSGVVIVSVYPDASSPNLYAHDSVKGVSGGAAEPPVDVSLSSDLSVAASETPTTLGTSLSKIGEGGLILNDRTYLTTQQFALMLGVSRRTLYRLLQDGKGPPQVKIAGIYYERNTTLKWAVERGFAVKQNGIRPQR
jgi:hypothetical protein